MEFYTDLQELASKLFKKDNVESFFDKHGAQVILEQFMKPKQSQLGHLVNELMDSVRSNESLFIKYIDPQNEELFQLIKHSLQQEDNNKFRIFYADCVEQHTAKIKQLVATQFTSNSPRFQTSLKVFYLLLLEKQPEIGVKILTAIQKMIKNYQDTNFFSCEQWTAILRKGIEDDDEVLRLRFMEIVVELSNKSQQAHTILLENGLLESAASIYFTNDILVRLNAVEILAKWGSADWNSSFLAHHPTLYARISQDAFNAQEDFYVRKYLAILIAKLVGRGAVQLTTQLAQNYVNLLRQLLQSSLEEETDGALQITQHLVLMQKGIEAIVSSQDVFVKLLSFATTTKHTLKKKFLCTLAHFFIADNGEQKSINYLSNILLCVGEPAKAATAEHDFAAAPTDLVDLSKSFEFLIEQLYSVFEDVEIEALFLLKKLLPYESIFRYFTLNSKSIDYLAKRLSKNKEIFDSKNDIIKEILEGQQNYQDALLKNFVLQLRSTLSNVQQNGGAHDDEVMVAEEAQ